jgi:hypothetical protein
MPATRMGNTRYAEERQGEWQNFESLIDLQDALNARVIKYRGANIATREIGVRGKSLSGFNP